MARFSLRASAWATLSTLLLSASTVLHGQSCTTATCTAATTSQADVLAALPSNSNANATVVVNIPAGSSTWGSVINYTVPSAVTNLTIQGATSINCTGTAGASSWSCPATDLTVITDGVTNANTPTLNITTGSTSTLFRITGVTFKTAAGTAKNDGMVLIGGNSHNVRLDHLHIDENSQNNSMIETVGDTLGVADHNLFSLGSSSNQGNGFRNFSSSDGTGDASWNTATNWGTISFWYLESDYFIGGSPTDCYNGGRLVVRYSTYENVYVMALHGTKNDAGRGRSCRATELYHIYAKGSPNSDAVVGQNGGTSLIWGNNIASGFNRFNAPGAPRNFIGGDSGTSPWGGNAGTTVRSAAGQGGTDPYDGNSSSSTGYPVLDGVGRGQGNLLSGTPASPSAWPSQKLEPEYMFMNTLAAANLGAINDVSSQVNRDVYADCIAGKDFSGVPCSSFNGTQGTGFGLLASRPATCTAGPGGTYGVSPTGSYGVAYWATDANSGNGELYVCTATNTWTGIYQPFVFPHPLVGGTTFTLTVSTAGAGSGTISGSNCSSSTFASGTPVVCNQSASTGSTFAGWSGGTCSGTGSCSFNLLANSTVTGTFTLNSWTLSTATAGSGSGTLVCTPSGTVSFGTSFSCVPTASGGSTLASISGCGGTGSPTLTGTMPNANCTVTATFSTTAATPTFSPIAGSYGPTQNVTLSTGTSGATICYRTDGTNPSSSSAGVCASGSTQYVSPVAVSSSLTIKAIATKAGYTDSSVGSAAYVINGAVATPTFSPVAGAYGAAQTVTISTVTSGASIFYTTDGSTPTPSSTPYSTPITVSTSQTVKAIATKTAFSNSAVGSAVYTINGTLPTPTFAPTAGGYGSTQTVTISATSGSPVTIVSAMTETSNANDSTGSAVHRNTYTNCATGYSGGQLQPAGQPVGTLYCTTADKTAAVAAGGPNNGVVTSTISGTGTTVLDNGNGAGGSDSPTTITSTYAGATGSACGAHSSVSSAYVSGLTFPDPGASSQLVMGIVTGSPGNSSILTVSKYNTSGDAGNYLARRDCATFNSVTVGGSHYEFDDNYNTSGGTYMGFGKDYDIPNKKFRAGPQGSAWINEELCPVAGGTCLTTYNIPAGDSLYSESYEHWDTGCTYSSATACAHYDAICLQLFSGGSAVNSLTCYNVRNASTHANIAFIPINKTSWTHPQYAIQHQWDILATGATLTATIPYSQEVAYSVASGLATICYTLDGSTPTATAGTCTHGTTYTVPLSISTTTTVKAIASQSGFTNSAVGTATYTINGAAATPVFSPVAGTYSSAQSVTITSSTGTASIYYTTDGTTPTTSSTLYSTPVSIPSNTTLKAIAVAAGYSDSAVASGVYVITIPSSVTVTVKGVATLKGTGTIP